MEGWGLNQRVLAIRVSRDPNSRAGADVVVRNFNGSAQVMPRPPLGRVIGIPCSLAGVTLQEKRVNLLKRNQSSALLDPEKIMHKLDPVSVHPMLQSKRHSKPTKTFVITSKFDPILDQSQQSSTAKSTSTSKPSDQPQGSLLARSSKARRSQTGQALRLSASRTGTAVAKIKFFKTQQHKTLADVDSSMSEVCRTSKAYTDLDVSAPHARQALQSKKWVMKPSTSVYSRRSQIDLGKSSNPKPTELKAGLGQVSPPDISSRGWVRSS